MGTRVFTVRDSPREILDGLRAKYGICSPNEKTANNQRFDQQWDPNEPIESLFERLEEAYIFSILAKPPFTLEQLIDKVIIAIQRTGLYERALLEWQDFNDGNKDMGAAQAALRRSIRKLSCFWPRNSRCPWICQQR